MSVKTASAPTTIMEHQSLISSMITFTAGASYGFTTVLVGQPLDTIKTRMQGMPEAANANSLRVGRELFFKEGIRGLYRGGLPLLLGGSLMRSAQFGVSSNAKIWLDDCAWLPQYQLFGTLDYKVVVAGGAGGVGRALVEIPTDFLKVRRQVEQKWTFKSILDGSMVTMGRNTLLFASFMVYVDLARQACQAGLVPPFLMNETHDQLFPFAKGAICANMAWLTCWPFDVVKTQRQSGNYSRDTSAWSLLKDNYRTGRLLRGLVPGLVRSSIANGSSMVAYEMVHSTLSEWAGVAREDMA